MCICILFATAFHPPERWSISLFCFFCFFFVDRLTIRKKNANTRILFAFEIERSLTVKCLEKQFACQLAESVDIVV